jgi:hypothetical protein
MAVAAGSGGEDQQGLVLVEVVEHLAVHLEHVQLGGCVSGRRAGPLPRARSKISEWTTTMASLREFFG